MEIHNQDAVSSPATDYQHQRFNARKGVVDKEGLLPLFLKATGYFASVAPVITYSNEGNVNNRAKEIERIIRDGDNGRIENTVVELNSRNIPSQAFTDVRRTNSIQLGKDVQRFRDIDDAEKKKGEIALFYISMIDKFGEGAAFLLGRMMHQMLQGDVLADLCFYDKKVKSLLDSGCSMSKDSDKFVVERVGDKIVLKATIIERYFVQDDENTQNETKGYIGVTTQVEIPIDQIPPMEAWEKREKIVGDISITEFILPSDVPLKLVVKEMITPFCEEKKDVELLTKKEIPIS